MALIDRAIIGNASQDTDERVTIVGLARAEKNPKYSQIHLANGQTRIIRLPYNIVCDAIDSYLTDSEELFFDLSDQKIDGLRDQYQLNRPFVEGKGLYLGKWEPAINNKTLGLIFNIYAAPENLRNDRQNSLTFTFSEAVHTLRKLENYHGHDGFDHTGGIGDSFSFENDTTSILLNSLQNGSYQGEWFIPTLNILEQLLYKAREDIPEQYKFNIYKEATPSKTYPNYYWSCSSVESNICSLNFRTGKQYKEAPSRDSNSVRLIRAEPHRGNILI
jgi:hypothetical protein